MNFRKHYDLRGKHALLSASKSSWINYTEEEFDIYIDNSERRRMGEELHVFAEQCIRLKQKLPKSNKSLNAFVNDAIGYRMTPEQILYYSEYCFGTADAISFTNNILRIHDLKIGTVVDGKIEQLMIYAALFCLEYNVKPSSIKIILRIYQYDEAPREVIPDSEDIEHIMTMIENRTIRLKSRELKK